jgi:tetratricopeptide (TPR) repeat protein
MGFMRQIAAVAGLALSILVATSPSVMAQAKAPAGPSLTEARKMRDAANAIIAKGKIADIGPLAPALKRALAQPDLPEEVDGRPAVYIDGPRERAAFEQSLKATAGNGKAPIAVEDPYPLIALILGLYQNETDHPDDALLALASGFSILQDRHLTEQAATTPSLMVEMAATFNATKQPATALKAYDYVLTLPAGPVDVRSKAHRGRGYSLIELGRLDEAEAAYNDSLKIEPGNGLALRELSYIASARKGTPKSEAPSLILTPTPSTPAGK